MSSSNQRYNRKPVIVIVTVVTLGFLVMERSDEDDDGEPLNNAASYKGGFNSRNGHLVEQNASGHTSPLV